jgi:hypothetical protein
MIMTVTGADVWTPREAADLVENLAYVYGLMVGEAASFRDNQVADGVSGKPIEFISICEDSFAAAHDALVAATAEADRLVALIADTIGSNDAIAGTQDDGALNVAANAG